MHTSHRRLETLRTIRSNENVRQCPGINFVGGSVVFEGGETHTAGSKELCYLGSEAVSTTPVNLAEEFDCAMYSASAPTTNDHPYLVLDSSQVYSWDFGSGGGFSCDTQLVREGGCGGQVEA